MELQNYERKKGYDSYLHRENIKFLDFHSNYTELIFLFDILEQVILIFNFKTKDQLNQFIIKLPITNITWRISELTVIMTYGNIKGEAILCLILED